MRNGSHMNQTSWKLDPSRTKLPPIDLRNKLVKPPHKYWTSGELLWDIGPIRTGPRENLISRNVWVSLTSLGATGSGTYYPSGSKYCKQYSKVTCFYWNSVNSLRSLYLIIHSLSHSLSGLTIVLQLTLHQPSNKTSGSSRPGAVGSISSPFQTCIHQSFVQSTFSSQYSNQLTSHKL